MKDNNLKGVCQLCFFRHALVERDDVFHDDEIKVGRRLRGLAMSLKVRHMHDFCEEIFVRCMTLARHMHEAVIKERFLLGSKKAVLNSL